MTGTPGFHPMTESSTLPALPLFPLGSVLFPGGLLPLRIFEVRYLDMIGRCHKAGAPFGVVALTEGSEVRIAGAATERFELVGTLARIAKFSAPHPGLLQIECVGAERFSIGDNLQQAKGLWTADVETMPDDVALDVPPDLAHTADALRRLITALELRQGKARNAADSEGEGESDGEIERELRLPFMPPWHFDDCGWLANRWCELLPLSSAMKQRMMVLDSPLMRLELVSDLLAKARISS